MEQKGRVSISADIIDIKKIANEAVGFAHTCYVQASDIDELSKEIYHTLSLTGGELVVIMPENGYPEGNWYYTREEICSFKPQKRDMVKGTHIIRTFEDAFILRLSKVTKKNYNIRYGSVLFLNEAHSMEQEYLVKTKDLGEQCKALKNELKFKEKSIVDLNQKSRAMEHHIFELNKSLKQKAKLLEDAAEKERASKLEISKLNDIIGKKDTREKELMHDLDYYKHLPYKYKDIASWIDSNFSGSIILTEKARSALKNGEFENISMLCYAIRCLADTYPKRIGRQINEENFLQGLLKHGLDYRANNNDFAKDRYDAYHPEYPEGSGKRVELRMHIRNNTDKSYDFQDPAGVLRIYFTYDKDIGKVVIHHLPGHLPT